LLKPLPPAYNPYPYPLHITILQTPYNHHDE
jgi:hypothetical protein